MNLYKSSISLIIIFAYFFAQGVDSELDVNGTYALSLENRSKGCMLSFIVNYNSAQHNFVLGEFFENGEFVPFEKFNFSNVNEGKKLSHFTTHVGLVATWEENSLTYGEKIIFLSKQIGRNTDVEFRKVTFVFSNRTLEMVDTHSSNGLCLYDKKGSAHFL